MEAAKFARDCLMLNSAESVPTKDVYDCYRSWCAARGSDPRPPREMAAAMTTVFDKLEIDVANGAAHGVAFKKRKDKAA